MIYFCMHPGITVGLIQTYYNTPETGGPLSVCVQMFTGNLERNVSLTLTTSDGTAIGKTSRYVVPYPPENNPPPPHQQ